MSDAAPFNAKNPFPATICEIKPLNGAGSSKDTRHVVISLADGGPSYEPGDSLGVLARNNPELIASILTWLGASGDEIVTMPKGAADVPLSEALARLEISRVAKSLLQPLAAASEDETLRKVADPAEKELISAFCDGRDLLDVLKLANPGSLEPQQLVDGLRSLLPRLYSIASSPRVNPGQGYFFFILFI